MTTYTGLRLEPVSALGLNVLEGGTIHWNASRQFFYPVGSHIRHYHLETNQNQFLFPERFHAACTEIIKICDVTVSANGQFVAISEVFRPNHGILSIYDLESQVAHVHLRNDGDSPVQRFVSLCFSLDGAMIAAIGQNQRDLRVFVWKMGRQVGLGGLFTVPSGTKAIAFDPQDAFRLLIVGQKSLATVLINTIDKVQKKIEVPGITTFDSFSFVTTVTGLLLVSSGNYLIVIMNDDVVEVIQPLERRIEILKTVRNFVFLIAAGLIWLFKANNSAPYLSPIGPLDLHVRSISEFSPSPDGDLAVVLYNDSFAGLLDITVGQKIIKQLAEAKGNESIALPKEQEDQINEFLASQATYDTETQGTLVDATEMQQFIGLFSPLPFRYHTGPIVAIATCPRKPLLATCGGQDRTLLVWNLAKRCVIASERLTEPVNSCSFHPSGDLLAVGTSEKLLLYSLTFDQLVLRQKWESLSCTCVSFSNGGHLLAAGSLIIKVIATYNAKTVTSLRGHNLSIKSIAWAQNDAFFISSGLDGNVFKWSAKSWDRSCEVSLPYQCVSAILSSTTVMDENSRTATTAHNVLVATSNSSIYDLDLKCERYPNRKGLNLTAVALPVQFSLVSGDQRGNLQVIPYPLLPAGEENPFHIGTEVAVHTAPVHCIMASSDGQTLFTAAEDSSIFIFNIVQPHQMVIAAPVALALSREEQSFLIERESFEEKQDNMTRLREVYNLHRSQFQCARTKLSEHQTRDIVQQKNKWQMTLSSLRKQAHALSKQKAEQEKKASEIIADCDKQHAEKIRTVKKLYESKLTEQTQRAADLMKEKIRIQCEYEDKLHQMAEEYKGQLKERRLTAQHDLESRAKGNVDAEKEFRQIERLQDEEKIVLQQEHKLEMEKFIQKYEERIAERNNRIEAVRTDLVGHQDIYDGHVETKQSHLAVISKINSENQQLEKRKQFLRDQIAQLKVELAARGERVAEQTNHLLELKGLNDELQKHRTVLDHHATVLKKELDPKDSEIEQLREKISENGSELRKLKISNAKDMAELEEKEQRINTLYNDILQAEGQSQRCEAKISQFKNKVHSIYTDVDPDGWPAELAKLHSEFVTHDEIEQEDQALRDALEEFETHKSALADKVVELRMKVEGDTENSGSRFIKQIGKNEELMIDLGRLRSENQKLKADLHLAQTELNALLRQCTRESKQLADKVKIMFRSTNLVQPVQGQVQRKTTREGVSMTVEQFHS